MYYELSKNLLKSVVTGWFDRPGCYVLFDGQYGSTGKGLLASVVAEYFGQLIDTVTTNAGPNSGHTGYYKGEKILTQQIPVASIVMNRMGIGHTCYLNAGAIIEPTILSQELSMYKNIGPPYARVEIVVHPTAALICPEHRGDQHSDIASTGKGVGPAMATKLSRTKSAVFGYDPEPWYDDIVVENIQPNKLCRCFVETAQGWSLGINSGFYPYVTSRECSVSQALSDLGVSPRTLRKSIVSLRTFPIRVGNTEYGYSGPIYPDQEETSFEELGVEPEFTTVTGRKRRIFTWSNEQFVDMLRANEPDALFLNFMNYIKDEERQRDFILKVVELYAETLGKSPDFVLLGYGPLNSDVKLWDEVPF